MQRTIEVTVDDSTWSSNSIAFPLRFHRGTQQFEINVLELLLTIGFLTTPSHASGVSLSEFWAWIRYLHSFTDDSNLRLTSAYSELDSHQKTILSDDFGMGVPICWLNDPLQLDPPVHGRYFIDRVAASVGAITALPAKQGPSKSPDFVARDSSGMWHVIECKGTQSGTTYRDSQLGTKGPPLTGGVAQKCTIEFPPGTAGQRLVCGLSIGVEGASNVSNLRIIDPPARAAFVVEENNIEYAIDAMSRSAGARALRLVGFSAASSVVSAPSGLLPNQRPTTGHAERIRQQVVAEKEASAREELNDWETRSSSRDDGERFRVRSIEIDLPKPIVVGGQSFERAYLRHGINDSFLDHLAENPFLEDSQTKGDAGWRTMIGQTVIESDTRSARMKIGSLFFSEIALMQRYRDRMT